VIPSVAGCTTGSLCPRCPYRRDEVLSLYQAEFLSEVQTNKRRPEKAVLHSTMCSESRKTLVIKRTIGKVARARWVL
jgi:hypothetical protein